MIRSYLRIERFLTRSAFNIAAFLLLLSVSMTFYQVLTRFILNDPSAWSEIMARSLMIWSVFLGSAAAFRHGAMISVEVIYNLFSPARQIWLHTLVSFLILLFLIILAWYGYQMTLRVRHQEVALIYISMSWFYAALPVGASLSIISVIGRYLVIWSEHRNIDLGKNIPGATT